MMEKPFYTWDGDVLVLNIPEQIGTSPFFREEEASLPCLPGAVTPPKGATGLPTCQKMTIGL